jgi:hypothetical protein
LPRNSRQIIAEAEGRFPVRVVVRIPEGVGSAYAPMQAWLDDNRGLHGCEICSAGTRGIRNDAIAVYMSGPTCAVACVARWCVPSDPPGFYQLRRDEPARRVPVAAHSWPPRDA